MLQEWALLNLWFAKPSGMFRCGASLASPHRKKFRRDTVRLPIVLLYLWPEGRNPRVGTPSGGIRENGAS